MEKNIGMIDRIIRFIVGILLFYLAFTTTNNLLIVLGVIFGLISVIESFIGYCGIYKLLNINTRR